MAPSAVPRPELNCSTNATISEALRDRGRLGCAGFARFAAIVTPRQRAELHKQHLEISVEREAMATTPQWVTRRHRPPHRGTGSAAADRAPTSGARGDRKSVV